MSAAATSEAVLAYPYPDPARRALIAAAVSSLAGCAFSLWAQTPRRPARVGILAWRPSGNEALVPEWIKGFDDAMRRLGWEERGNVVYERRYWSGAHEAAGLAELAGQLVALDVDVIFARSAPAALAAAKATDRIPVVFLVGDAIGRGVVTNFPRPGGNVTGVSGRFAEVMAKRVELLKQLAPAAKRVAVLGVPDFGSNPLLFQEPRSMGVETFIVALTGTADVEAALADAARRGADAIVVAQPSGPAMRRQMVEGVARLRLPAAFPQREHVELGGLLSFGIDPEAGSRQAAAYVDKILRGSRPADLPVDLPMDFDLAVNMRTARELGIAVPRDILVRADRIVE